LRKAFAAGAEFTPLQPLGRRIVQDVDRPYPGPVTVVFDGFSYSATDVFAALVQDQAIGPTLSTHGPTGGGGANVWSHDLFCELSALGGSDLGYEPLPRRASFTVAMRRLYRPASPRSGHGQPVAIEDHGVVPDQAHRSTRRDVIETVAPFTSGNVIQ
jgi:Peptidase family S41